MPKGGKDRRSGRGTTRGRDLHGGLGGDEDYDWIRYLGEGRSSASPAVAPQTSAGAARPSVQASAPSVTRPAVRPGPGGRATGRSARPAAPAEDGFAARGAGGGSAAAGRSGRPADDGQPGRGGFAGADYDGYGGAGPAVPGDGGEGRGAGGRDGRLAAPAAGRPEAGPQDLTDRQQRTGRSGQAGRAERTGPMGRAGRAVKVRPGRTTDLLFNPAADDYGQPLYPAADDGRRLASQAPQDWQQDDAPARGQRALDTSEFARPLYPPHDGGRSAGAPPRPSWPDDDPLADTDGRGRPGPGPGIPAARPGRSLRSGRASRPPMPPELPDRTGPQRRVDALTKPAQAEGPGRGPAGAPAALTAGGTTEFAIGARPARTGTGPLDRVAAQSPAPPVQPPDWPPSAPGRPARIAKPARTGKKGGGPKPAKSRPKQRKGGPGTRRRAPVKALILGGSAIAVALAVAGYLVLMPHSSHIVSAPVAVGGYVRQQANATAKELKHRIVAAAPGDVKNVVAAVYERKSGPGTSKGPQIVVFIGGNLTGGASAGDLISAYMTRLNGAFTTSAGRLGGQAACAPGANGGPAECAWADDDTFGVVVSATLSSAGLADEMRQLRPLAEHLVK